MSQCRVPGVARRPFAGSCARPGRAGGAGRCRVDRGSSPAVRMSVDAGDGRSGANASGRAEPLPARCSRAHRPHRKWGPPTVPQATDKELAPVGRMDQESV